MNLTINIKTDSVKVILILLALLLSACSDSQDTAKTQETTAANAPASNPAALPTSGKVVKAMHASGYTYMQVENSGKQFWVAAKMLNVRRNDHVTWTQPSLQKNFNSPTLRRTFDEILFVATAQVDE